MGNNDLNFLKSGRSVCNRNGESEDRIKLKRKLRFNVKPLPSGQRRTSNLLQYFAVAAYTREQHIPGRNAALHDAPVSAAGIALAHPFFMIHTVSCFLLNDFFADIPPLDSPSPGWDFQCVSLQKVGQILENRVDFSKKINETSA